MCYQLEALQYKMDLKWAEDMEKQREMDELRVRYGVILMHGMMDD